MGGQAIPEARRISENVLQESHLGLDLFGEFVGQLGRHAQRLPDNGKALIEAYQRTCDGSVLSGDPPALESDDRCFRLVPLSRLSMDDVNDKAIPTVADAGWFPFFKPSAPTAPVGETRDRRDPAVRGYPEIVHRNRDMVCVRALPPFWEAH